MAENLYNSEHKATNKPYRDNYDRIFNNCGTVFTGPDEIYKDLSDAIKAVDGTGKTIFVHPKKDFFGQKGSK